MKLLFSMNIEGDKRVIRHDGKRIRSFDLKEFDRADKFLSGLATGYVLSQREQKNKANKLMKKLGI